MLWVTCCKLGGFLGISGGAFEHSGSVGSRSEWWCTGDGAEERTGDSAHRSDRATRTMDTRPAKHEVFLE